MKERTTPSKRNASLDVIRVVAMMLVVVVHLNGRILEGGTLCATVFSTVGRMGVPLFVMLSGYLLVDRDYSGAYCAKFLKGNLLPLYVSFVMWTIVWVVLSYATEPLSGPLGNGTAITWSTGVASVLFLGPTRSALWYLQMIIALYLGMPIISRIACEACERPGVTRVYGSILILIVVFGCLATSFKAILAGFGVSVAVTPILQMNIFGSTVWGYSVWVLYLLTGYFIKKGLFNSISTSMLCIVGALSFGGWVAVQMLGSPALNYDFALNVLSSACLFLIILRVSSRSGEMCRAVYCCSLLSYAVYVTHIWVIIGVVDFAVPAVFGSDVYTRILFPFNVGVLLLIGVLVVACSLLLGWLISRIRFLRKWALLMK